MSIQLGPTIRVLYAMNWDQSDLVPAMTNLVCCVGGWVVLWGELGWAAVMTVVICDAGRT